MIYLEEDSREYDKTVFDIIRLFIGHYTWQDLSIEENAKYRIRIKKEGGWAKAYLNDKCEKIQISDDSKNEVTRKIKKIVYILLRDEFNYDYPWGILTGIRPTKAVHRAVDSGVAREDLPSFFQEKYLLSKDKSKLLVDIALKQTEYFLKTKEEIKRKIAVYISIPFCPTICSYCTFPSYMYLENSQKVEDYLNSLKKELKEVFEVLNARAFSVQTLYFGGGTPTSLNRDQLDDLLGFLSQYVDYESLEEFSFEAGRPDTITEDKLKVLKKHKITRISINPQTMKNDTLKKIGRMHTKEDIIEVYKTARKVGFDVINMDLILGLVDETNEDFLNTIDEILDLSPENITIHSLAYKRKSAIDINEDMLKSKEKQELFAQVINILEKNDYDPYYLYKQKMTVAGQENIGFAKKDKPCLYNIQMIEERQIILGFGSGSTSKYLNPEDMVFKNVFNPKDLYYYNMRIDEIISNKLKFIDGLN